MHSIIPWHSGLISVALKSRGDGRLDITRFSVGGPGQVDMADKRQNQYSIVLFGKSGVGKSSLALYFVQEKGGHPDDDQLRYSEIDPTIEDSFRKQCVVDDETCLLDITDTAGAHEFEAMWMSRIEQMALPGGFMLVFDFTWRDSFHILVRSR